MTDLRKLKALHEKAVLAARAAADAQNAKLGDEWSRGFDCGFAWVNAPEVRGNTKLGKAMMGLGYRKSWAKGYYLWYSDLSASTQSVSVHEAAARAYVDAMKGSGVKLTVGSRLD